jgi:alpha-galactosidase
MHKAIIALLAVLVSSPPDGSGKVKVFILAGQSNMEGHGFTEGDQKGTLRSLLKDQASVERYKHLVGKDGKWVARDDVWIVYNDKKGILTVGGYGPKNYIGPELGFGWGVGDYLKEQVLLLKFAWGGTSLAKDWRPPSSGGTVGDCYTKTIEGVKGHLKNLKASFPGYDGRECEIAGFGWHQGWNDGCSAEMTAEYEKNMVNFIRDVRKELGVKNLPFVIANSGFGGWETKNDRRVGIMKAQAAAANHPDFKGTALCVETRGFFRPVEESPSKQGYHWNGNFETHYLIGEAMGKAMVELLGGPKAPPNPTGPAGGK